MVALRLQHGRHPVVGSNPVMHVVSHNIRVQQVMVADFHPDANGLRAALRNQLFVEIPGAIGCFRIERPLLVNISAGVGDDPVIPFRVIPRHLQGRRTARTTAHDRAPLRVFGQLHLVILFNQREHFGLNEFREFSGHRVVFQAALAALGIAAAIGNHDGKHHGEAVLRDHVVENVRQAQVRVAHARAVVCYYERRRRAGNILAGDINGDCARIRGRVGFHDQSFGIVRVNRPGSISGNPGVEFAVR